MEMGGDREPSGPATVGAPCSASCAAEFERCVGFGANTYSLCRDQLNDGHPPLKNAGCAPQCADTASMAAFDPSGSGSGAQGGLSDGALAGIIAGSVGGVLMIGVVAYLTIRRGREVGRRARMKATNSPADAAGGALA